MDGIYIKSLESHDKSQMMKLATAPENNEHAYIHIPSLPSPHVLPVPCSTLQ